VRVADGVTDRFRATLVAVLVATAVLAVGITGLAFDTSQNGLIGKSSKVAIDNVRYQKAFGGEAMLVLESGPVEQLFTPANLGQQRRLEARLRATGQFSSVIGPVDALEFAANQLKVGTAIFSDAIAQAQARGDAAEVTRLQQVQAAETSRVVPLVVSGKLSLSDPAASLDQPDVVKYLLYDETGQIRPILRDNFPNTTHGLVIVRLQGNTDIAHIGTASDTVKNVVRANPITGFRSLTTGPPVLLKDINDYLQGGMATLGGLAILVMTIVLFFVFRVRWRLLSLAVVALGALTTFGILGYASIALSLVTISGFPILIGLAVDFAIQVHSRFEEEVSVDGDGPAALRRMYRGLAPALTVAMTGAALGFVAIQVSRVPIIRDFGVMLDVGVVLLFLIVVLVPPAMLVWRERRVPTEPHPWGRGTIERVVRTLAFAAERLLVPILVIGLALVATGLVVEGDQKIQTDPEKWVPQGSTVVHDLRALRQAAGFSSEIGLFVEAPDVTSTSVTSWMQQFGAQQVAGHQHDLLRATSLPAIVAAVTRGAPVDKTQYDLLVSIAPAPFKIAFVSPDGKSANMVFPVGDISLGERQKLLERMGAALKPPSGVKATFSGLAVVGVELVKALQANRSTMIYLSLGAVAL